MNKKGTASFVYFMIGIAFFVLGLAIAPALVSTSSESMSNPSLNCTTTTDSQTKSVCTQIDLFPPLYVGLIFGLAGLLIGRVILG